MGNFLYKSYLTWLKIFFIAYAMERVELLKKICLLYRKKYWSS